MVLVALVAIVGVAGLAIDTAHVLLNKARLQNTLDATALAAAKILDQSGSTTLATASANSVFALNVAQYPELQASGLSVAMQYSATLNPFSAGTTPARFVRAAVTGFNTSRALSGVLGIGAAPVHGSAVAGPSPTLSQACDIVPILLCGTAAAGAPLYGYTNDQVVGLNKVPSSGATGPQLGPGNYNLLSLGSTGAAVVRTNFAGDYSGCGTVGNTVTTEPGVAAGPVSQGLNTRFNVYQGPVSATNYPPDVINSAAHQTSLSNTASNCHGNGCPTGVYQGATAITTASQLTFNWQNYNALNAAGTFDTQPAPTGTGRFRRREVAVPIGDCSSAVNGRGTVNVLGFACIFLLQELSGTGQEVLYGQIVRSCEAEGKVGAGAGSGPGPHIIELYKSAGSADS